LRKNTVIKIERKLRRNPSMYRPAAKISVPPNNLNFLGKIIWKEFQKIDFTLKQAEVMTAVSSSIR